MKTLIAFTLGCCVIALVDTVVAYLELEDQYNEMSDVLADIVLEPRVAK